MRAKKACAALRREKTNMKKNMETALALVLLGYSMLLQSCSIAMAASGHEKRDTSVAFPGSNRAVIII